MENCANRRKNKHLNFQNIKIKDNFMNKNILDSKIIWQNKFLRNFEKWTRLSMFFIHRVLKPTKYHHIFLNTPFFLYI